MMIWSVEVHYLMKFIQLSSGNILQCINIYLCIIMDAVLFIDL